MLGPYEVLTLDHPWLARIGFARKGLLVRMWDHLSDEPTGQGASYATTWRTTTAVTWATSSRRDSVSLSAAGSARAAPSGSACRSTRSVCRASGTTTRLCSTRRATRR